MIKIRFSVSGPRDIGRAGAFGIHELKFMTKALGMYVYEAKGKPDDLYMFLRRLGYTSPEAARIAGYP